VTSVITGASRVSQVAENMGALDVLEAIDDETKLRIESIVG
jgi:aryl-alcohol dehydrogenase-like predicted oxidoreductase